MTPSAETLFAAVALVVGGGSYAITNAGRLVGWARGRLAAFRAPDVAVDRSGESELLEILAAVHRAQVKALDKPADVRTAALAECDRFGATMRNLYGEDGP